VDKDARAYVQQMLIELAELTDEQGEPDLAVRIRELAGDQCFAQPRPHNGHDGHAKH
jgi:hypothetical protein